MLERLSVQVCTHLGRGCVSVLRSGHMKVCGMGLYVGGGADMCVYLVRGQGEWAVYKGIAAGVFGKFTMFKTKTMNGRRNKSESCYFPAV